MIQRKKVVTILGDYLGEIISQQLVGDNKIELTLSKLRIHKVIPVTNTSPKKLIEEWQKLKQELDSKNKAILLTIMSLHVDKREINIEDILPCIHENASAIILLRDAYWNKVPLDAIGVPSNQLQTVAKYYTLYQATMRTYNYLLAELDKVTQEAIRWAEYARSIETKLAETSSLLTEYQKAVSELHTQLKTFISTIQTYEKFMNIKEVESEVWKKQFNKMLERLPDLLNVSSKVIELSKKLATVELGREIDVQLLRTEMASLSEKINTLYRDISNIRDEINRFKQETPQQMEVKKPEEESSEEAEEEGEEEIIE